MYDLAIFMSAPLETRINRIKERASEQYGDRVREGGDMYEQQLKFVDFVATRPLSKIEQWTETLACPVIHVDGTKSISQNTKWIIEQYGTVGD